MTTIGVTVLGPPGSGRTTLMAAMSAWSDGRLSTSDPGGGPHAAWRALTAHGLLPREGAPVHDLVLRDGDEVVAVLRCAEVSPADPADPAAVARVAASDAVHLVLDGGLLAAGPPDGLFEYMTALVRRALDVRRGVGRPAFPVVVLISKTDLIVGAADAAGVSHEERLAEVVEAVPGLLPVVRDEDVTAMVCPVQVGWFGAAREARVDPARVHPHGLDQAVVFTAGYHLAQEESRCGAELRALAAAVEVRQDELAGLGRHRRGRRRELESAVSAAVAGYARVEELRKTLRRRTDVLSAALAGHVPVLRHGHPINTGAPRAG
ncbi:hypothetical protein GCM10022243_34140 [Saccharothrix violaceirubra]|uniref:Uncharacterized protein n=1 Tax=Saccharothrix violaceirubra TaxID=413306 RepID=A0A7W7WWY1_9PSEU|nr:hypothetical protein [Saccharothrix violaceirubra]MBB4966467.1 hypothetical protein [Saccharothrix violaceirubra]